MNILAMDLGKSKTMVYENDSKNGKHKYYKVLTSPQKIHGLIAEKCPTELYSRYARQRDGFMILLKVLILRFRQLILTHRRGDGKMLSVRTTGIML